MTASVGMQCDNIQTGVTNVQTGVTNVQTGVINVQTGVTNVQTGVTNVQTGVIWSNWFHASYQVVPPGAVTALEAVPILNWLCSEYKYTLSKLSCVSEKIAQLKDNIAGLYISLHKHMHL